MSEQATPQAGPVVPPAGPTTNEQTPPTPTPPTPSAPTETDKPKTVEEAITLYEKEKKDRQAANNEAHNLRTRLKVLEDKETERAKAEMTDLEKARAEAAEAAKTAAAAELRALNAEVVAAAAQLNFNDPKDAIAFLDKSKITADSDISAMLAEVLKEKPYLAKTNKSIPDSGGGNPPNDGTPPNKQTNEERFKSLQQTIPALQGRVLNQPK